MSSSSISCTSYWDDVDILFHCPLNISLKMMHYHFANMKDHNNKVCKGWTYSLKPWRFLWLSAAEDIVGRRSLESRWNAISREDDQCKPGPAKTEEKDVVNIQDREKIEKKKLSSQKKHGLFSLWNAMTWPSSWPSWKLTKVILTITLQSRQELIISGLQWEFEMASVQDSRRPLTPVS